MNKQSTVAKMAIYVRYLADKVPVGEKAAQVSSNVARASTMLKLAREIERQGDLFKAVDVIYADKSAAYRHQTITGLVGGFRKKLLQAQRR